MPEVIGFYLIALLVSALVFRRLSHPVVIFNTLWLILLTISIYGVLNDELGFYQPSSKIYTIFFIGGLTFNLGAILCFLLLPKIKYKKSPPHFPSLNQKCIKLFLSAEIVLLIYYAFKALGIFKLLLSGQTYDAIRQIYFSEEVMTSSLEFVICMFVFDPLLILTEILFAINLFMQIMPKKMNYLMLLNLLLFTFISGGRTSLFVTGCLILICAIYFGYLKNLKSKKTIGIFLGLFALVFVTAKISSHRHGDEGGVMEIAVYNLVSYFIGSFTFFEDLLASKDYLPLSYGIVSFGGITDIFIQIFRYLQLTDMQMIHVSTGSILDEFRPIGELVSYNAMPTMYYYFYTDFREFGYILCPFVFGSFSVFIYNKMTKSGSLLYYVYYLFIMILIVESSFNWPLVRIPFFIAIVFSYYLLRPHQQPKFNIL